MKSFARRALLFGTGAVLGAGGMRLIGNETISPGHPFPPSTASDGTTVLNDASLLNPTRVAKHLTMRDDPNKKLLASLRAELADAKSAGRPFAVSAARHSMGAQSLAKHGTAITLAQDWLEPDTAAGTYRVAAGMRWGQVISKLDKIGYSPKVMQSNNDFGVASTFCVNAHGWPVPFSAFGSTVRSLQLLLPDGELIVCSRARNSEQFNLAMGGYGLTGVVTELEIEMVPNSRLLPNFGAMQACDFGNRFVAALTNDPAIQMAYGRLNVTIGRFFEEALMITYKPTRNQDELPPASGSGFLSKASARIFREQLGSDRVKSLRWLLETKVGPTVGGYEATRNTLVNEPVATLDDGDPTRTDILHEYFVSPERFAEFIVACQDVIPSSYQDLLNVTLRFVDTDTESVLAYATEPRIAAVMLFSQEMSERGEADMARMTSAMIERTLAIGGTYYLPYRLHATDDQFRRGYSRASEFVDRKRSIDPGLVFRNALSDRYMAKM